jgi:N-acetylmuramoyl-L-alanine amidase
LKDREHLTKVLKDISTESLPNGLTRYYGGKASSYSEAQELLNLAKSSGFPTAFVVVFKNGVRVNGDEVKNYMK